jgi:hypothetical protein
MNNFKTCIAIAFIFSTFSIVNAQDSEESSDYSRKGKFMIETGYSLFLVTGVTSGTGGIVFTQNGTSITALGADMGTFLSEDFALKFKLSYITSLGTELLNLGFGGKYYIAGIAPLEFGVNVFDITDEPSLLGNISIGYAAKMANNIYMEPSFGLLVDEDGDTATKIALTFALLF